MPIDLEKEPHDENENINENTNASSGKKNKISHKQSLDQPHVDGSVILLWTLVIGSLLMIVVGIIDVRLSVGIAGILVTAGGIAAIVAKIVKPKTAYLLLLPVIGLGAMIIPPYLMLSEHFPETFPPPTHEMRMTFWGLFALLGGLITTALAITTHFQLKKSCTLEVEAVCIGHEERHSRGYKFYAPIWEYYVNGNICRHTDISSSTKPKPEIGHTERVLVNTDEPSEIFRPKSKSFIWVAILGVLFMVIGGFILSLLI